MTNGANDNGEILEFNPNPSPEEMAAELVGDSGVWAVSICATEIEDGQKARDYGKVQYWLKVTRALADRLIEVT